MSVADERIQKTIDALRARRERALGQRASLVAKRTAAERELRAAERRHGAEHRATAAAATELGRVSKDLQAAREDAADARAELRDLLERNLPRNPEDDVARLDGQVPIVLLPVRLETRFERRAFVRNGEPFAGVLKVRIYPDAIAADSHEPLLTEGERDAGFAYWTKAWADANQANAWTALTAAVPSHRAAWIVSRTAPNNLDADFPSTPGNAAAPPAFPDVELRPQNWQRPPSTRVLPDRWVIIAYRAFVEVRRAVSSPVIEPLSLSMTFSSDGDAAAQTFELANGLELDDEIAWTMQFARAVEIGMAVELPLKQQDLDEGFNQLLAIGVKSSVSPAQAADRLSTLIDAHHYSRGFSFVPQGAPTNNVGEIGSWFPPPDPRGELSFRVERGAPLVAADQPTDGSRFMRALGVPIETVAHLAGAERDEQRTARAMTEALWPCTLGYFLEHMMYPLVDDDALRRTREYVTAHVRGRGPYPAFRVGDTPYGILPVTFIDEWVPYDDPIDVERRLAPLVTTARNILSRFLDVAPRIGRSADADADLLETLGMDASAREVWVRRVLGSDTTRNLARLTGINPGAIDATRLAMATAVLEGLGHPEWDARALYTNFSDPPYKFAFGLVVNDPDDPLSETAQLEFNYINWLRTAPSISTIRDQRFPDSLSAQARPLSLLYRMLRHGALQQYTRNALDILIERKLASPEILAERELIGIAADSRSAPTVWQHLVTPVAGVTGGRPIDAVLTLSSATTNLPPVRDLERYRDSLAVLEQLPTAELERLFTETLDVSSHRVDAWATAMAARRLDRMRADRPAGCHVASFGWVEDLRADPPEAIRHAEIDGRRVRVRADSGGYVQAPSMTHGAAAAVLLNAYLTRSGPARDRYAVDLSSRRTRIALEVLDAVRNGQPLGAVLGYQFERGLHEGHPGVELDRFIDDFRNAYPLARNEARDANEPAESIVARNVVDGLALRLAWRGEPGFDKRPWETVAADDAQRKAIEAELGRLDETVDAVTDLLLADSVFQIVSGKMDAAGASLKTVGEGARPPEGEITRVPRTGTDLTHRVAMILGGAAADVAATWGGPHNERARVEPHLNGWIGSVLGDPRTARCEVRFGSGAVEMVTLDLLAIDPLDFLALASAAETASADAELDRRVRVAADLAAAAAGHALPDPSDAFTIRYDLVGLAAGQRSVAAVLEAARALNELLGICRALEPKDLIAPERASDLAANDPAVAPDLLPAELQTRAAAARARFAPARVALENALTALLAAPTPPPAAALNAARAALRRAASFGVAGAYPRTFGGDPSAAREELARQATSVLAEMERRAAQAADPTDPVAQIQAIFGRDFKVLPRFRPARPDALQPALVEPPLLGAEPDRTLATWAAQSARVRKPLAIWRRVQQYARAFRDAAAGGPAAGDTAAVARVAQLPFVSGAAWVGLPFAEAARPPAGRISLMLHGSPPAATAEWTGLLVDEWMELIPNRAEETGVVFHHDSPSSQAPQALLVAVPPARIEQWSFGLLVKIVQQTLFHAKIRAVDREHADFLYGQLVPMIYLAQNTNTDTVSTTFGAEALQQSFLFRRES